MKNWKNDDLYRFLSTSLKNACASYGIKNSKKEFDFERMKNWNDVFEPSNKRDCIKYLIYDVLSLDELLRKFSLRMWKIFDDKNISIVIKWFE